MNITVMVILSCIIQPTKYTCYKEGRWKRGKSVVDHVCIDEGFLYMLKEEITREDVMKTIKTDHAMVIITCEIKSTAKNKEVKNKQKNSA